jgi:hypothetical protein
VKPETIRHDTYTHNDLMSVPMSKMNINTIGEALTGHIIQLDQLDGDKLRFEDNSIIKKGFEGSR